MLYQSVAPIEVIVVVDDIDNEAVLEYLYKKQSLDARLIIIKNEKPQGLAYCRNVGIKETTGDFIALMDADDIAEPERFEAQHKYLEQQVADVVFSQVSFIDERGTNIGEFSPMLKNPRKDIFLKHVFAHPTAFAKATLFDDEKYDTKFKRAQDIELWIRLIFSGKRFAITPQSLLRYRLHRNQAVAQRISRQSAYAQYGFKIARKHFRFQYKNAAYWVFATKWLFYYALYTIVPNFVLVSLVKLKDLLRK